jgi:3-deoxy-D-manno-octulosonate 8-phosphate phosphatase (KDO 8-P phosphatase)
MNQLRNISHITTTMNDYRENLKYIRTFIFDYDGVLSDGRILFSDDGQQMRNGNVKDGFVIQLAQKLGFRVVIISGADTPGMHKRCGLLRITDGFLGVHDKLEVYERFKSQNNIHDEEVMYMGDDLPDYNVMKKVRIACCPSDATIEIRNIAHYISHLRGGEGCVRDVIEQVLRAQGKWMTPEAFVW